MKVQRCKLLLWVVVISNLKLSPLQSLQWLSVRLETLFDCTRGRIWFVFLSNNDHQFYTRVLSMTGNCMDPFVPHLRLIEILRSVISVRDKKHPQTFKSTKQRSWAKEKDRERVQLCRRVLSSLIIAYSRINPSNRVLAVTNHLNSPFSSAALWCPCPCSPMTSI